MPSSSIRLSIALYGTDSREKQRPARTRASGSSRRSLRTKARASAVFPMREAPCTIAAEGLALVGRLEALAEGRELRAAADEGGAVIRARGAARPGAIARRAAGGPRRRWAARRACGAGDPGRGRRDPAGRRPRRPCSAGADRGAASRSGPGAGCRRRAAGRSARRRASRRRSTNRRPARGPSRATARGTCTRGCRRSRRSRGGRRWARARVMRPKSRIVTRLSRA